MRMGTGVVLTLTNAQKQSTMTIGTAEYIREHVYRDCPHYSFQPCVHGHLGCSSTDKEGGPCMDELEAENNQRIDVLYAAGIIDAIYMEANPHYTLVEDKE